MAKTPLERNAKYWDERAVRRLTDAEKQSDAYIKRIQKMYDQANRNIQRDIEDIYRNYSKATGLDVQSLKELLTASETDKLWAEMKRKGLDKYVKGNYKARISRLEKMQAQIYAKAKEIYPKEALQHTMCYEGVVNSSYYKAIYDAQMGTGFDFAFSHIDDNMVTALLNEPWSGANYSARIWGNTDILAESLIEILGGALLSGQSIEKTSRQIRERFGVAKHYAERLVRTETNHFNNEADAMAYEEMDVDKYVFLATLDTRTSTKCQEMDNQVIPLAEREVGKNFPPLHPNCRSKTRAYMGEEIEKTLKRRARNPITGKTEVIDNMSYEEWAKKHGINTHREDNIKNPLKNDGKYGKISKNNAVSPTTTIADEQKRALKYADDVSFDGATNADNIKTVNDTLEHLTAKYPTKRLETITVEDLDGADAKGGGRRLRLNRNYINSPPERFDWDGAMESTKAEIAELEKGLDGKPYAAYVRAQDRITKLKRRTKFSRATVASDGYGVKGTVTHEYGHVLAEQRIGLKSGNGAIVGRSTDKDATYDALRAKVRETYRTAKANGDIFNISLYADTNEREFFAEAFSLYEFGEKLPQYIVDMITEVLYV